VIAFEDLTRARELLGLPVKASLPEIRASYKQKLKEVHPDKRPVSEAAEADEETRRLVRAYEILMTYVAQYPYSFSEKQYKEVRRQDPTWAVTRFWDKPGEET